MLNVKQTLHITDVKHYKKIFIDTCMYIYILIVYYTSYIKSCILHINHEMNVISVIMYTKYIENQI